MLNSPLEIQMSFEDDFTECLHRFQCLESGALNFLLCLRSLCNIEVRIEITARARQYKYIYKMLSGLQENVPARDVPRR